MAVIEDDPQISTDDIAIKVGISTRAIRKNIKILIDNDIVSKEGTRINPKWVILSAQHRS